MKITEKKCPNCGANLKFKAGEHNAHCESCRRDFVIEYEVDDAGNLSDTFDLTPAMTIFGKIFAIHSVIIVLISVIMIIAIAFGIFQAINSFNSINERRRAMTEDYDSSVEEMNKQYQDAVKELEKRQGYPLE
jgi:predicted  nucleic acid-binding Zn-ribbon protein